MEAISDLPMLNDIDADYSPQYVKLARIIRDKIEVRRPRAPRSPARPQPRDGIRRISPSGLRGAGDARRQPLRRATRRPQVLPGPPEPGNGHPRAGR